MHFKNSFAYILLNTSISVLLVFHFMILQFKSAFTQEVPFLKFA